MNKPILEVEEFYEDESPEMRRRRNSEHVNDYVQVMTPQPIAQMESDLSPSFSNMVVNPTSKFMGRWR